MFVVECDNCRAANGLDDTMKNKTVRCFNCNKIVQVGTVKKEVVRNINQIDNHELRIKALEKKNVNSKNNVDNDILQGRVDIHNAYNKVFDNTQCRSREYYHYPSHTKPCCSNTSCSCSDIFCGLLVFSGVVFFVVVGFVGLCSFVSNL